MTTDEFGSAPEEPGQAAGSAFTTGTPPATGQDPPDASGGFNYQGGQGFGFQGDPGEYPAGYAGNQIGGPGGMTGQRISGGINRSIVGAMSGPGPRRGRRGRSRIFWYIRIAFWLIGLGVLLYVFVIRHGSFVNCNGNCDPGG